MLGYLRLKDRLSTKIFIIFAVLVLIIIYSFLFPFKKTYANEITLFPGVCEGNWLHAAAAAGDPTDAIDGAQSMASGDTITCRSFTGETLPDGVTITGAQLEFVWSLKANNEESTPPSIEDSYDAVPTPITPTEEPNSIEENSTTTPTTEEVKPTEETPEAAPSEPETSEPTSYLPYWHSIFTIPIAQAEESISTPAPESTEASPESTTNNSQSSEELQNQVVDSSLDTESSISTTPELKQETSEELETNPQTEDNVSENNTISTESEQTTNTNEKTMNSTPLFTITTKLSNQDDTVIGSIIQEQLGATYPLTITATDISDLQVSLTSLLTIDSIEHLSLQGIKLVITYEDSKFKDPIRQPDLRVDTVLDDLHSEDTRVIRIQRADNKEYEIWYRSLAADAEEAKQHHAVSKQPQPESSDTEELTNNINNNITTSEESFSPTDDTIVTNSMSPESKEFQEGEKVENNSNIDEAKADNDTQAIANYHPPLDTSWSFVAGRESVSETCSVAFKDSIIFWINAHGGALYAFNIATQGISSRSYNPQDGDNYIIYRNPSSEEKKVIFDFSSKQFIFP